MIVNNVLKCNFAGKLLFGLNDEHSLTSNIQHVHKLKHGQAHTQQPQLTTEDKLRINKGIITRQESRKKIYNLEFYGHKRGLVQK